jgi:hypothetical protein
MSQFTSLGDEFYGNLHSKAPKKDAFPAPQQEPVQPPEEESKGIGYYAEDIAKAVPRGILGAASDVADLGTMAFGYDVPDYFGLMEPSKTMAGGVTEGVTNFLTGFIPGVGIAGKLGKVGKIGQLTKAMDTAIDVAKVAGKTKKAAALKGTQAFIKGSVGGAIADFGTFDGHEARLSNLLREHAGLTDPFTAYLAADENDSEIEGRLKNAIEGLVIGGLTEGLFNAFRMYKAGYFAKSNGLDVNEALAAEAIKIRGEQRELVKTAFNLTDEQAEATNILIDRMGLDRKKIKIVSGEEARVVYETAAGTEAVLMQQGKKFAERVPELQEAAQQLKEGKITREDYAAIVDKYKPVRPLTEVPAVLGPDQARAALSSDKAPRYGVPSTSLKEGDEVGIRLDIPAYRDNGVWVVSVHESQSGFSAGKSIGYESTAVITDARFGTQEKAALSVAAGKARDSIATIKGKWKPMDAAQAKALADEAMSNPTEWRQVGVDLERHSYFYDRETMRPITAADEVVQIGNAVFAKNAKYGEASKFLYQERAVKPAVREWDESIGVPTDPRMITSEFDRTVINDMMTIAGDYWREQEGLSTAVRKSEVQADKAEVKILLDDYLKSSGVNLSRLGPDARKFIKKIYSTTPKFLEQSTETEVRGFAAFADDGKSIIGGLSNPDVSTAIEEITHVARRQLFDKDIAADVRFGISDADIDTAARWSGATEVDGKWTWSVDAEERFAAGFNSYLRTGEAPAGLEGLFRKMSDWLIGLYREIKGSPVDVKVSKDMEKVFSNLLERGPGFDRAGAAVAAGAPVLRSTTPSPGSAGLGKPPEKELNLERFSSVDEVNRTIDDFIAREPLASTMPEAQRSISEVARAAQTTADELRAISGMEGLDLQRMLNEGTTSRWQIERATRELTGLRKFAANAGNRLHELSKKGSSASKEEMYEFLVGERSLTIVLQTIKERSREVARSLGALRYVPTPEKSFTFLPSFKPGEAISPGAAVPPPGSAVPSPGAIPTEAPMAPGAIPTEAPRMPVEPPDAVPTSAVPGTLPKAPEAPVTVPTAPSGLTPEAMDEIMTRLIDQAGGADAVRTSMNRYLAAAAGGGDEAVLRMARGQQKWMSALVEFWMNNILSGPITHAVNNSANLLTTLYLPFERILGASIRGDMKTAGIAIKQYSFLLQQAHDSVKMAGVALKMDSNVLDTIATRETGNARAISAKGLGMAEDSIFGQAANWIGTTLNLPTRFLTAEDEFFKQLNYRASFMSELYVDGLQKFRGDTMAASRYANETFNRAIQDGQMYAREVVLQRAYKAADEAIAAGTIAATERGAFVGKYMGKQKNWDSRLGVMSNRALDNARAATFSTPLTNDPNAMITTRLASRMQQVANEHPAIRFLLPFIRTPTNLLNFTLDRSIFKTAYSDAPKAFRDFNRELNHADAAIRADAAGRLAFSFALTSVVATAALSGKITGGGPKNKGERDTLMQAGWQPYSIKIGDKYFSYKREDPFASIIGLVADTAEGLKFADDRHMDAMSSTIYTIVLALARNITNKTYLTGITNVTNAISNPEQFGPTLVNQYVSGLVPFSAALDQSKSTVADDPVLRDARNMIDAIYSKIPFLAEEVTPQRNILGEVMEKPKAVGPDIFSPVIYSQVSDDLILQEFGLLGHGFTPPKAMKGALDLTQFKTFRGQQAYDRWLELHGSVRVRGKTLRQALATTIKSKDYQKLSPSTTQEYDSPRVRVLRGIISDYRAAAYAQLLKESPELTRADRLDFANKKALRMGRSAQELFDLINR